MDWETLRSSCLACTRCELCKTRTNVVFGQGVEDAEVLFVGEGPGQNEDEQGLYLQRACDILLEIIEGKRPCGYVENIGREGTRAVTCTLRELRDREVNMFTTVFIGNSETEILGDKLITKRGYHVENNIH